MNPTLNPITRAHIIADSTRDARAMVFVILVCVAVLALALALRYLLDLALNHLPPTRLARVSRALEADSEPKYLPRRRAA